MRPLIVMARRQPARSRRPARPAATASTPRPARQPATVAIAPPRPDVVVDFNLRNGLLFVSVQNIGAASAYQVVTRFDQTFRGLGGRKDLTELALFRSLLFLPPGKRIRQLVDAADAYFQRHEPTRLTATITYADRDGRRYTDVIPHELEVYRDLAEPLSASGPERHRS
jgi:hypothetical protein